MTLPFSDCPGRKYVCFCCGLAFTEIKEYKDHIVAEHDEGREFITCPVQWCKCPVRDIPAHFRANHPSETIPKNIQMRTQVWLDHGNKKKKKMQFASGYIISEKNGNTPMHYRSSYERSVYDSLEQLHTVIGYKVEPFKIPYVLQGKSRTYHPDLVVWFGDGSTQLWEIKPSLQTSSDLNKAKWAAAAEYCTMRGWTFKVLTEKGIANLILEVKAQ